MLPMKIFVVTGVIMLMTSVAFAQTPDPLPPSDHVETNLATPTGHDVSAGLASYTYSEPGAHDISIHAARFVWDYTGTLSVSTQRRWFAQAQAQGTLGNVTYDGWCSPFVFVPESTSPNGYALDVGDPSPCSESGDKDWYLEGRAVVGKEVVGQAWAWSPRIGLGIRHLSNGITGVAGYRTDDYLYLPIGITARTMVSPQHVMSLSLEYDRLLHGWQKTRDSQLGGGDIPATPTAPAFTLVGFSDISFAQQSGWALRARAMFQLNRRWSVGPEYVHWNVSSSPVNYETATFVVHNITAVQQVGAYEPLNRTNELVVTLGLGF